MIRIVSTLTLILFAVLSISAQSGPPDFWFNLDPDTDRVPGVATEKAYKEVIKGKKGKTIVVAVIDSGIDPVHEDLKDVMWTNPGEIAGNGKDDDGNGYTDDIHGWNFIGGPDGRNVHHETYEVTRLYGKDLYRFENADRDKLPKKVRKEYDQWLEYKKVVDEEREKAQTNVERMVQTKSMIDNALSEMEKMVGDQPLTTGLIDSLEGLGNSALMLGINIWRQATAQGEKLTGIEEMQMMVTEEVKGGIEYYSNKLDYAYNPDFDSRSIVGDNYEDQTEQFYGNNDVEGPDAFHGTHVAGIIGAVRHNGIGMNGVAHDVALMSVRAVPDGDERDKDVANAIRYAVDNGASIINMSFGKGQSWNKEVVDDAVKYAEDHDVLLVHAAGNSHQNNDASENFPTDEFEKSGWFCSKRADNWIEVGALSFKEGEDAIATFSNFGKQQVDLFAPGVAIFSTIPDSKYRNAQGTSMASPVVAGVAAVVRSQYPLLTAEQVKEVLMSSVVPIEGKVKRPDDKALVEASEISVTGGTVNLYNALKAAAEVKGKRKKKKSYKSDAYDEYLEKANKA